METNPVICPKCKQKLVSRIDNIFVELFGQCWMCDFKALPREEFKRHESEALTKKYEKEN